MKTKQNKWWIVIINLGGISGPICCDREGTGLNQLPCVWDRSGNHDCSMVEGLVPIGGKHSYCTQYQTQNQAGAKLFALGAKTLATHLIEYLSP